VPIGATELNRLRWRCRRGLLENDLVLARFLERHGATLDRERLTALDELLALPDPELWALVSGREECEEPRLAAMVAMLRES
jgi:succinate dehydrogenase flavin-adding protein (antitoxin of CptAB toxin-antitoxin module)